MLIKQMLQILNHSGGAPVKNTWLMSTWGRTFEIYNCTSTSYNTVKMSCVFTTAVLAEKEVEAEGKM